MKLVFIRHGDPNYAEDCLTELGKREAGALAYYMKDFKAEDWYVSPLGRAAETARIALSQTDIVPLEMDWLREFNAKVAKPNRGGELGIAWDWLPGDWLDREALSDIHEWDTEPEMAQSDAREKYDWVCGNFDQLLAEHGYVRDGNKYRVEKANNDTLVFFCHFGVTCVILSHLLHISPMNLWHGFCAPPTSLTTVVTEERIRGIAGFRVLRYGEVPHLRAVGMEPAVAARFCECYDNEDERH